MKKVLSIVLTLAVLICSLCVSASAKTDEYDFLGEIAIYGTPMIIVTEEAAPPEILMKTTCTQICT